MRIFAVRFERNQVLTREHSSVGLEHLPYKQRVGGSTPSAPTKSLSSFLERLCSICHSLVLFPAQLKIRLPTLLGSTENLIVDSLGLTRESRLICIFCNTGTKQVSRMFSKGPLAVCNERRPFGYSFRGILSRLALRSLLAYLQVAVVTCRAWTVFSLLDVRQ